MFTWNEIREKTLFDQYSYSETDSTIFSSAEGEGSDHVEDHEVTAQTILINYSNGVSETIYSETYSREFQAADETVVAIGTLATTSHADCSLTSFSLSEFDGVTTIVTASDGGGTSTLSVSDSNRTTSVYGIFAETSTTQTFTSSLITTSNVPTTTKAYFITGASLLTYSTGHVTAVSTASSTTLDDGFGDTFTLNNPITTETTFSALVNSSTSITSSTYLELGTAVSMYGQDEWLWRFTREIDGAPGFDTSINFITDIAQPITETTFWPSVIASTVSFGTYDQSAAVSGGIFTTLPGNASTITYNYLTSNTDTTEDTTLTSGQFFSRGTSSTTVSSFLLDTTTATAGFTDSFGFIFNPANLTTYSFTESRAITTRVPVFIPHGLYDSSTTTATSTTAFYDSTTASSILQEYLASSSSTNDFEDEGFSEGETTFMGATANSTATNYAGMSSYAQNYQQTNISPLAAYGAFVLPDGITLTNFDWNIEVDDEPVYFPNTASVYANVATPIVQRTTATEGDFSRTTTWNYRWSGDIHSSFSYSSSKSTTHLSGGHHRTSWDTFSSTASFGNGGATSNYFTDGGAIFGGYNFIPGIAESEYRNIGAFAQTAIDTDGGTTSSNFINTEATSLKQVLTDRRLFVTQSVAALVTFSELGAINLPLTTFHRNTPDGF